VLVDWLGLPRIYMVVRSVGLSVVIALHSKHVSVLDKELFQLSGFTITQVWSSCNHVLQLQGSVGPVVVQYQVGSPAYPDHSVPGGSYRELRVMTDSIEGPHRCLLVL
jgi:hypothetical protein